jgi:hypothetical protein
MEITGGNLPEKEPHSLTRCWQLLDNQSALSTNTFKSPHTSFISHVVLAIKYNLQYPETPLRALNSVIHLRLETLRLNPPSILCEWRRSRIQELFARLRITFHLPVVEGDGGLAELTPLQLIVRGHMTNIQVRHDRWDLGWHVLVVTHALYGPC